MSEYEKVCAELGINRGQLATNFVPSDATVAWNAEPKYLGPANANRRKPKKPPIKEDK